MSGGESINGVMYPVRSSEVYDPVAHCAFHWTSIVGHEEPQEDRLAFVTCDVQTLRYITLDLSRGLADTSLDGKTTDGDVTTERKHLPTVNVDGIHIECLVVRSTRLDAADKPHSTTMETCYSPDLQEEVRSGIDEESDVLTHIRRTDPDPKLFYPPDGYRIEVLPAR